jgi:hypothetical protein
VIVGRSNIVGKPMAMLLMQCRRTVTVCHSQTKDLAFHTRRADILVAAVGKPRFVTGDMVKPGATVIDVGINRLPDGKLCGDVDFEAARKSPAITPVPGGVGPMTITMLLANTLEAPNEGCNDVVRQPLVGIVMGSDSDWPTMQAAAGDAQGIRRALRGPRRLGPPHARPAVRLRRRRPPNAAQGDHRRRRRRRPPAGHAGRQDHRAGARRAGAVEALSGQDSLLSIVQMPKGIPVATFAIGEAGRRQRGAVSRSPCWPSAMPRWRKLADFRRARPRKCWP